jgi:hypothetical protein
MVYHERVPSNPGFGDELPRATLMASHLDLWWLMKGHTCVALVFCSESRFNSRFTGSAMYYVLCNYWSWHSQSENQNIRTLTFTMTMTSSRRLWLLPRRAIAWKRLSSVCLGLILSFQ